MSVKFTNNAKTNVVTGINASATSLTVASASSFPSLSGAGDYCYLTIQQAAGVALEVVKATALSGNTFTIVRAQDNTSAGTWSAGDIVELRVTAAALDDISAAADTESVSISGDTMTGDLTVPNLTTTGNLTVQGDNLDITQSIRHRGDENTGINFFSDEVSIKTGGAERLKITNSDINIKNSQVFFNASMGIGASTYSPIENNIDSERNWLNFHRSNGASYVEFTNRTPAGKIVLSGGVDGGGGEVQRLEIQGGSGTKDVRTLASTNLDITAGNLKLNNVIRINNAGNATFGTISGSALTVTNSGIPTLTLYDNGNAGGGAAEARIKFQNTAGTAIAIGYTDNSTNDSDLIISTNAAGTYGGYLGLTAAAITDAQSDIILEPKTDVRIATGGLKIGTTTVIDSSRNLTNIGTIQATGTVTATGGNSTNWNTAYGWGNHATAGYNNASNLSSGTLPSARLSGTYSNGLTFSSSALRLRGHMYFDEYTSGRHYVHFVTNNSTNQVDWRIQTNGSNTTVHSWYNHLAHFRTPVKITGNIDSDINGNNTSGGNIRLGATGDNATKWFAITGRQYNSGTETEGYSLITGSVGSGVNNVTVGGGLDEQNAATVVYVKAAANSSTRNGTEIARFTTSGLDIRNNVLRMTGTTVIDASRNLTNIGTLNGGTAWRSNNDGSGSGLDADLLDGYHASTTRNSANTIPIRDGNGYLHLGWINTTSGSTTNTINKIYASNDNYIRYVTPATFKSQLGLWHTGNDGSGSGLDADTVDGVHASKIFHDKGTGQLGTTSSWDVTTPGMYGVASSSAFTGTNNPASALSGIYPYGVLSVFEANGEGIAQLYTPHTGNKIALRTGWNNGNWHSWQQMWTSTSDGSGSGLDADTVDGIQAGSFLRSDTADTASGDISFSGGAGAITLVNSDIRSSGNNPSWTGNPGAAGKIQYHSQRWYIVSDSSSNRIVQFRRDGSDKSYIDNNGALIGGGNWYSGNDGSGSGLDADTVDGFHVDANNGGLVKSYQDQGSGTFHSTISEKRSSMGMAYMTDGPNSGSDWYRFIQPSYREGSGDSNVWQTQLAFYGMGGDFYLRQREGGSFGSSGWGSWTRVWTSGTDGSGSGLDADLLDGQHGSYYARYNDIRSLGTQAFTSGPGGSNSNTSTATLISEMESDGAFDSYTSVFKTSWSYASNDNLTDAGRFTETAGTSWITWTDNSSDSTRGNITALAIAPNTGGSAGKVFIYNDQGSSYAPGWREVWTSTSDGSGSGLDADLLDGQHGSHYLNYNNLTNKPSIPSLSGYATESYVGTQISNLVDSSPSTLNTLNELAAALGDDANFSTTVTNSIATKLPLSGGTMTGAINMGSNNLSGINNATAVSFLSTNGYWVGGTQRMNGSGDLINIGTISSGAITARADTDALFVKSITNQNAAEIAFSSQGPSTYGQVGRISYQHGDALAYGGTDVFTIGTTESAPRILADGLLMFKSGLALKPASGTGAGTTIIDSSRNLTNIGTISSGAITIDSDNQSAGALRIENNVTDTNNDFYFAQEIIQNLSGSQAATADREQGGIYMDINSSNTGGDTSNEHRAYGMYIDLDSTGDADLIYGVYANATATPTTGTTTTVAGGYFYGEDNGGAGSVTNVFGVNAYAVSDNPSSDTNNLYAGFFKSYNVADSASIGTTHGVYSEVEIATNSGDIYGNTYVYRAELDNNAGAQSNNTYLYYGNYAGTLPTAAYGVYIVDAVDNWFAGNVRTNANFQIGSTTVIDSSRNLTNIGTISSGSITSSGDVKLNGNAHKYAAPVYRRASIASISSSAYTTLFTVNGNNLGSDIRLNLTGTTGSVVVNVTADIQVGHYEDILVTSRSGFYTRVTLRITSDNNEDFAVEATTNSTNALHVAIEVFPQSNESVTFTSSHSFTGSSHEHTCHYGTHTSGTGGNGGDLTVNGRTFLQDGSISAPALTFRNDHNTGLYRVGSDSLGWVIGGSRKFYTSNARAYFQNLSEGVDVPSLRVSGTTVIDSSRNLTNIGTISSGAITTTTGAITVKYGATHNVSLTPTASGGVINARNSSGTSVVVMDARGTPFLDVTGDLKTGGTTRIDSSGNATLGTISSGHHSITTTGTANGLYVGGGDSSGQIKVGSYTRISGATKSNTGAISFNANYQGGQSNTWAPDYAGSTSAGMFVLRQDSGGAGSTSVWVKNHGTTSTAADLSTFTKVAQFHQDGYFSTPAGLRIGSTEVISSSRVGTFTHLTNSGGAKLEVQGGIDGGNSRGIFIWDTNDPNWGIYMAASGSGKSLAGGTAAASLDGATQHHIRFRCYNQSSRGWIFENSSEQARASINANTGNFLTVGNVTAYASDERLKENITPIADPIEKIKRLQGVEFDWKSDCEDKGFIPSFSHETGVIAQNIAEVVPDAVSPAPFDNDYLTVDKSKLVAVLIEAVKAQQETIESLTKRIEEIENGYN